MKYIPFYVKIDIPGHDKLLECLISNEPAKGVSELTGKRTLDSILEEISGKGYQEKNSQEIVIAIKNYLRKARENGNDKQGIIYAEIGPYIEKEKFSIGTKESEYYILYVRINEKPVRLGDKNAD